MTRPRLGLQETAEQRRAFEDYWALGYGRSVRKLVAEYRQKKGGGQRVPSTNERRLEEWCSALRWVSRCTQREAEEAQERRAKNRERADKFRDRLMKAIEIDASAYAQKVFAAIGEDGTLGNPVIIDNAASMDKAARLFFQLAEQPLAEKHEVSGTFTAEVHEEFGPEMFANNPAAHAAAFALAAALNPGPDDDPGTVSPYLNGAKDETEAKS